MITVLIENIANSLESIMANKLRSALSMLGIIIGVSSVIILSAIGNGSSQSIIERIEEMGTNILTISPGSSFSSSRDRSTASNILNEKIVNAIKENVSGLDGVLPIISSNGQLVYGANDMNVSLYGVDTSYLNVKNVEVTYGSNITETDINELKKVAIVGQDIVNELFGGENPVGENVKMGNNVFQIIGVIEENSTLDSSIFIPITTAGVRITGRKYYSQIIVSVSNADEVDAKEEEIDTVLQEVLAVADPNSLPYNIRNQSEMLENMTSITETLTLLLSGIAGISLLVGGIGVMNIMLVSVTERTKEIGIRKAIGAGKKDILLQFLTEALSLSILGGAIGIGVSYLVVYILNYFSIAAIISPDSIIMSFFFSLGIGLIFGILPAYKAAKLRPINALRFE